MRTTLCTPTVNPWRELDRLFAAATRAPLRAASSAQSSPASNLFELEDGYELQLELPGVKREQLKIELQERKLAVQILSEGAGEAAEQSAQIKRQFSLAVPRFVDAERVEAKLENGILTLKLPKSAEAKSREIEIR